MRNFYAKYAKILDIRKRLSKNLVRTDPEDNCHAFFQQHSTLGMGGAWMLAGNGEGTKGGTGRLSDKDNGTEGATVGTTVGTTGRDTVGTTVSGGGVTEGGSDAGAGVGTGTGATAGTLTGRLTEAAAGVGAGSGEGAISDSKKAGTGVVIWLRMAKSRAASVP